jgi:hypothetical protein
MKNFKKLILGALALLAINSVSFAKISKEERDLCQTWKLWKVEETGKEVAPENSRYLVDLKKNKTFTITKNYKIAHRGTWEYARKTLVFHDKVTNKDIVVPVREADHSHLVLNEIEGKSKVTFMTPVSHKDAIHLTHQEHILVKKWTIYQSTNPELVGSMYDFHEDKTWDYFYNGQSVPVSSGKWTLSEYSKALTLELKKNEKVVWDVIEFHRHAFVSKSQSSGNTNKMHDAYLTEKDGIILKKDSAETVEEVQDEVDAVKEKHE